MSLASVDLRMYDVHMSASITLDNNNVVLLASITLDNNNVVLLDLKSVFMIYTLQYARVDQTDCMHIYSYLIWTIWPI